jgi:predicted DCC family thiol-disulfide oxidoreductase YuxK
MRHYMKRDREHRVEWVDIAAPGFQAEAFGLDAKRLQQVMHARTMDGRVYTQVGAFVKIWEALPGGILTTLARWILKIPGTMAVANVLYRLFARNRYRLTGRCTAEGCDLPRIP